VTIGYLRDAVDSPAPPVGDVRARLLLATIRTIHSAVFLVLLSAIAWLVGTGLTGRRDRSVVVAGALVAIESGVFVANRGVCPLTPLAERYGARRGGVSDIFLPDFLARTIPLWATPLVVVGFALHVWHSLRPRSSGEQRDYPVAAALAKRSPS
jgi:hypothetical protein